MTKPGDTTPLVDPDLALPSAPGLAPDSAFVRVWSGFTTARLMIALVLFLLQCAVLLLSGAISAWLMLLSACYLVATVAVRFLVRPLPPGQAFDQRWIITIGADVLAFSLLQWQQTGSINYAPLLALPVLMASVMGTLPLALGTAAGVTLLMLAEASWGAYRLGVSATASVVQSGLTGTGYFVLAFIGHQLAVRLADEETSARRSRVAEKLQTEVNDLVIESMSNGILVVDLRGTVRTINPAARRLLGAGENRIEPLSGLASVKAWQPLSELALATFREGHSQAADVAIQHDRADLRLLRVHTRLTSTLEESGLRLCVMFLQDLREMQARIRTEKMASMGRMSAAVAHEIRNPLAAIAQANALLDEDLNDPAQKRLSQMVQQNTQRLSHIVDEILNISRVQHQATLTDTRSIQLDDTVRAIVQDWQQASSMPDRLHSQLGCAELEVEFDADHLRRVLINLLDNAARYASSAHQAIEVSTEVLPEQRAQLRVWSDGPPLEQSVQRHLFEPFFSSESRNSGLGLYLCRELCERHGAEIAYQRSARQRDAGSAEGNEFHVSFRPLRAPLAGSEAFDSIIV